MAYTKLSFLLSLYLSPKTVDNVTLFLNIYFGYTRSSFQHAGSFNFITCDPVSWSRSNLGPLYWEEGVLATGPPGSFLSLFFLKLSLVVQPVKNLPEIQEIRDWSLAWEDPLEKEMATHSSILAWRIPWTRGAWRATVHGGHKESDTTEQLSSHFIVAL